MIMRTENAVAAVKTALSPATKPPKGRRVMVERRLRLKQLMGLESVSRDGDAVIEAGGKDGRRHPLTTSPARPVDCHRAGMLGVYIRQPDPQTISANPVGTKARKRSRGGAQWLWPIFATNKPPGGKNL
ncbi:hypothetical protein NKH73_31760 [Mesorhizobium sp. M0938]|uniref:hypothetical protein n=1 Tax=unclassified Mesorhizobium TaxID=325217 RepID=UPI0033397AFB